MSPTSKTTLSLTSKLLFCLIIMVSLSACSRVGFSVWDRPPSTNNYSESSDSSGWRQNSRKGQIGEVYLLDANGEKTASLEIEKNPGVLSFAKELESDGIRRTSMGIDLRRADKSVRFGVRFQF